MKVLVDTSVWSLALRRKIELPIAAKLQELIEASQVVLIGPIRQELLSGIAEKSVFQRLRSMLEVFDDLPIEPNDYTTAAEYYNLCRQQGVQGSQTDFLICSLAVKHKLIVFTTDQDFTRYASILPLTLL